MRGDPQPDQTMLRPEAAPNDRSTVRAKPLLIVTDIGSPPFAKLNTGDESGVGQPVVQGRLCKALPCIGASVFKHLVRRTLSFGPALSPSGMHRPPLEGRGRGMAPRGLAWPDERPHRWKEKRGIPRPQRSVDIAGTRTGRCFTPLAQVAAGGVQACSCSTAGPWTSSPLGRAEHGVHGG
jgi:hypothetical protein